MMATDTVLPMIHWNCEGVGPDRYWQHDALPRNV